MSKNKSYQRFIDIQKMPNEKKILATLGTRVAKLWKELRRFLKENYDFQPELHFYGKKYGWCYKYTRKGKTLCVLFPETKAFSVLVTLGKKEVELFEQNYALFNNDTQKIFANAHQYHDGKWIYKRVLNRGDLQDVLSLIQVKKKLKK